MKEMEITSLTNLPGDVLTNKILLKFDTKFLGRLRCVRKYLQSFIGSPAFLNMHISHQHNNNPLVLLVSGDKSLFYSVYSFSLNGTHIKPHCPEKVEIVSLGFSQHPVFLGSLVMVCYALLKERTPHLVFGIQLQKNTKNYHLSPRSSSIESPLLSPHMTSSCSSVVAYGLGYDSSINDYKIIQCENSVVYRQYIPPGDPGDITEYTLTDFQVYTLGTDTWRRINDNPYEPYFKTPYHYTTPGMFVNGALHWILRERESFGSKIIAFDIEKEMFRAEVPKPHSRLDSFLCYHWSLHVLKGCLCIYERLRESSPCIDVWMMKDYGSMESWTKLFTIDDHRIFPCRGLDFKVLKFCQNGKVIVARDYGSLKGLIVYDPISRESQSINLGEIPGGISYKEIHIESLVSLNTGIYRYGMVENKLAFRRNKEEEKINLTYVSSSSSSCL